MEMGTRSIIYKMHTNLLMNLNMYYIAGVDVM